MTDFTTSLHLFFAMLRGMEYLVGVVVAGTIVFAWAMCRAASIADRALDSRTERRR